MGALPEFWVLRLMLCALRSLRKAIKRQSARLVVSEPITAKDMTFDVGPLAMEDGSGFQNIL